MDLIGRILVRVSAENLLELRRTLELDGHKVTEAGSRAQMIQDSGSHDLALTEISIDQIAAHGLCRAIRSRANLGIIVLGEPGASAIDALNAGADDYVPAPYIMPEVAARVRALLRRVKRPQARSRQIMLQDRAIDLESRVVRGMDGSVRRLTPKEFLVLEQLLASANRPRTHQYLAQTVWQRDAGGDVEYMRMVIKQLRRKLEPNPEQPRYILTQREVGYQFCLPSLGGSPS